MPEIEELQTSRLAEYSENDARELGLLMTHLSTKFSGEPINEELLTSIIESPFHEQLVARYRGRIVGAATLSIVMGVGAGKSGYLMDFVTDPEVRGQGVGKRLWTDMMNWCEENSVQLTFTSRADRTDAHAFYLRNGASIKDTTVFSVNPTPET